MEIQKNYSPSFRALRAPGFNKNQIKKIENNPVFERLLRQYNVCLFKNGDVYVATANKPDSTIAGKGIGKNIFRAITSAVDSAAANFQRRFPPNVITKNPHNPQGYVAQLTHGKIPSKQECIWVKRTGPNTNEATV